MVRYMLHVGVLVAVVAFVVPATAQEPRSEGQTRAYLGAMVESAPRNAAHRGAVVRDVSRNSPAEKAGLKRGDIITKVDDKQIEDGDDVANVIHQHKVGDHLTISVMRDGKEQQLTVNLLERPAGWTREGSEEGWRDRRFGRRQDSDRRDEGGFGRRQEMERRDEGTFGRRQETERREEGTLGRRQGEFERGTRRLTRGTSAFLGLQTRELTPEQREQYNLNEEDRAILVTDVVSNSAAEEVGVRRGDVIIAVEGRPVTSPEDLRAAVQKKQPGEDITLSIMRGNRERDFTARLEESPVEFGMLGERQLPQYRSMPGRDPFEEIQNLERRIRELEKRLRDLESNRSANPK